MLYIYIQFKLEMNDEARIALLYSKEKSCIQSFMI